MWRDRAIRERFPSESGPSFQQRTERIMEMSKIKSTKQFKEQVDAAFATRQTRDEAKACVRGRDAKPLGVYPLDP